MIIRTASLTNLHGQLNFSFSFKPDVNILIGVNGSGKTSVLNAIAWTLSPTSLQDGVPAAYLLSNLNFDEINIAYTVPSEQDDQRVIATRYDDKVGIQVSGLDGVLEIPIVDSPGLTRSRRMRAVREGADLVARLMEDQRDSPVLQYLSGLPGPL